MIYIVVVNSKIDQINQVAQLNNILKQLFNFWLNGCFDNVCEFGVFSNDFSGVDIGISFLSIYSLYFPIRHIDLYDLQKMIKFRISINKVRTYDISFSAIIGKNVQALGYQLKSNYWVKPLLQISKIHKSVLQNLEKLKFLPNTYSTYANPPRCREDKIHLKRINSIITLTVYYKCDSLKDYEELYKTILFYRLLVGKIHKTNAIIKPIWKLNKTHTIIQNLIT